MIPYEKIKNKNQTIFEKTDFANLFDTCEFDKSPTRYEQTVRRKLYYMRKYVKKGNKIFLFKTSFSRKLSSFIFN